MCPAWVTAVCCHCFYTGGGGVIRTSTQAAPVPTLELAVGQLQKDKASLEASLAEEGWKVEQEKRRSKAWRDQVEALSVQVRGPGEKGGGGCTR